MILGSRPHANFKFSFIVILLCKLLAIGNCLIKNNFTLKGSLPIATNFKFPSPLPTWPAGDGFATGEIDLGGLQIRKVSSFQSCGNEIRGGPGNMGANFFYPTNIPAGFSMLGAYAQPNNQPLFGWVLVGKTDARDGSGEILKPPTNYQLIGNSPRNVSYFWLPIPPAGYKAVGLVVTGSAALKPGLDKIRCVRADFTDEAETDTWIWGESGMNVYALRPKYRGTNAQPVSVGTFIMHTSLRNNMYLSVLKNKSPNPTSRPNLQQVEAVYKTYAPFIYFHPEEAHFPSSVNWFFDNGAWFHKKEYGPTPAPILIDGSNLPQGNSSDGSCWMDLPAKDPARGNLAKGDLATANVNLHVKPVLGATFTDIQVWVFYPFNNHAVARLGFVISKVPLGHIGEHVGDWEHVTLRVSNFDGTLYKVFYAQHNGGKWVDASQLEYQNGNKFVVYSALNGHASYHRAGLVLIGGGRGFGIRDDTAKGQVLDSGSRYWVMDGVGLQGLIPQPWVGYPGEWGPKITYKFWKEVYKVERVLPGRTLKAGFRNFINKLPAELRGQEGPTAPKVKNCWDGDETPFRGNALLLEGILYQPFDNDNFEEDEKINDQPFDYDNFEEDEKINDQSLDNDNFEAEEQINDQPLDNDNFEGGKKNNDQPLDNDNFEADEKINAQPLDNNNF